MTSEKYNIKSIDFYQTGDCNVFTDNIYFCGCDLRCGYCYNKELWTENGTDYTLKELFIELDKSDNTFMAFMGGEPLRWNLKPIIETLHKKGKRVVLFTAHPNPWFQVTADFYHIDIKLFSDYIYTVPLPHIAVTYGLVSTGKYMEEIPEKFKDLKHYDIYIKYGKTLFDEPKILKDFGANNIHLNEKIKLI